jgi:hypothetical protein
MHNLLLTDTAWAIHAATTAKTIPNTNITYSFLFIKSVILKSFSLYIVSLSEETQASTRRSRLYFLAPSRASMLSLPRSLAAYLQALIPRFIPAKAITANATTATVIIPNVIIIFFLSFNT